jgi:hypothetical protein
MQPSTRSAPGRRFIPCWRSHWFAAVALGWVSAAWAGPVSVAATATGSFGGVPATAAGCGTVTTLGTPVSCDEATSAGSVHASARADFGGRLRGETLVTQTAAGSGTLASAGASFSLANVSYRTLLDDITVRVRLRLDGTQSVSYDATTSDGTAAVQAITFIRYGIRRDGSFEAADFDELLVRRALLDFGPYEQAFTGVQKTVRGVEGVFDEVSGFIGAPDFEFELLAGSSFFDFNFQFATNAFVRAGVVGSASTDYFRTASIEGFQVFDRAGRDVTASSDIRFTPGEFYGAVPEPTSLALAGCALGLLARQRRSRRSEVEASSLGI